MIRFKYEHIYADKLGGWTRKASYKVTTYKQQDWMMVCAAQYSIDLKQTMTNY